MAMEVVCGNCQGRLLVEHTGVVVACPHCGAHLQIGDPAPPAAQAPPPSFSPPAPQSAPPQLQFAPPEFAAPQAPPPVSPFPISFEPPPVAAFRPPAQPEPVFPEIILTPPAPPSPPPPPAPVSAAVAAAAAETTISSAPPVDLTPQPVAQLSWEPPQPIAPPAGQTASDSWMPQINLTLPPAVVETPPQSPAPAALPPLAQPETVTMLAPAMPVVDASPSTVNLSPPAPSGAPAQTDIWNPTRVESSRVEEPAISFPGAEPAFASFGNFSTAPTVPPSAVPALTAAAPAAVPNFAPTTAPSTAAAAVSTSSPTIVTSDARRDATVPRVYFVVVASYASAMTLAFLYLWARSGEVSTLDLPDVRPQIQNDQYGLRLGPEGALPTPFRLKLGETKRYGNLLVTPLKVTKGPLEWVYFDGSNQTKPPTPSPVLKLWVKFENVSSNQTFPALDETLLFKRVPDRKNPLQNRSNNYICRQSECKPNGKRVPVYTFPIKGDWLLKGQHLDTPLRPKDEWETYIPSNDEDLSDLKGPLCWRVHFRKGYNPRSRWGVTTLIEVEFDSADIQADS